MIYLRLKTSLYRLCYKYLSRTKHKIVRFKNAEFVVRPDNYIDRRMWIEGGYEKAQLAYLRQQARTQNFDAFLDVGANFGLYSCVIGTSELIPALHAFECDPRNLQQLYGHLKMNKLSEKITVHDFAVGDQDSEISFQLAPDDNTGKSYIGEKGENTITVNQKPLDQVLSFKNKKLLLKIDVEGYEEHVLKGARNILSNNKCFLQIEILDDDTKRVSALLPEGYKSIHNIGHDWYFTNLEER